MADFRAGGVLTISCPPTFTTVAGIDFVHRRQMAILVTPAWPLTLLTRNASEDPAASASIAQATNTGSHIDELTRWKSLALAEPRPTNA